MNLPSANKGPRADSRVSAIGHAAGSQFLYSRGGDAGPRAEVQRAPAVVGMRRELRVLAKDSCGDTKSNPSNPIARATSQTMRQSARASPGGGRNGTLPRDRALGVGHRAVLLAPRQRRQQHVRERRGVGVAHDIGDDDELAVAAAPRAPCRRRAG